jgi:hypothetical protein
MKRTIIALAAAGFVAATALPAEAPAQAGGDGWWEWAAPALMGGETVRTPQGTVLRVPDRRGDTRQTNPRDRDVYRDRDVSRDRGRQGPGRGQGQARGRGQGGGAHGQAGVPAFCRQGGGGHPVFGQQWCRDRGHGGYWQRGGWEDVIFRSPRDTRRGHTNQRGVIDVLGDVVFGRLDSHRRQLGASDPLVGRWQTQNGVQVFQVRSGAIPVAEFTDLDGDGRVDLVLLGR